MEYSSQSQTRTQVSSTPVILSIILMIFFGANFMVGHRSLMPINGFIPTSLPAWQVSNKMHSSAIGPIRSRGTKPSILIGPLEERPGILPVKKLH